MLRGGPHHVAHCRTCCPEDPICGRSAHDRAARGSAVVRGPDGTVDADASPTKWHRAHTSWFFEEFVLAPRGAYQVFDPTFRYLFNSYYEAVGPRHPRPQRGLVTRPGVVEIARYRAYVDRAMTELLASVDDTTSGGLIDLGCHHEQQHQELLLMDAKHLLAGHPFAPVYVARPVEEDVDPVPLTWRGLDGGLHEIGHTGDGFAFDNEGPRH